MLSSSPWNWHGFSPGKREKINPPAGLRFRPGGQGGGAAVVRALPQGRGKGDVRGQVMPRTQKDASMLI